MPPLVRGGGLGECRGRRGSVLQCHHLRIRPRGNLTEKIYSLNGETVDTVTYGYGGGAWADVLTSFDDQSIEYDTIGNPTTWYDGAGMDWQHGRQLASYTLGDTEISYTYNHDRVRTSKTVNDVTTTYDVVEGTLRRMSDGTNTLEFVYGNGLSSVIFNDTEYWYVFNTQGDVIGLIDTTGAYVVEYTYDSWGKILSQTDSDLARLNPFRYRGYIYDEETGLYYCQTRYYDPNVGRWLNADGYVSTGQDIADYNMYAYCGNNSVNRIDSKGMFFESFKRRLTYVIDKIVAYVESQIADLNYDQKVLIATIAAEATVTADNEYVSSFGRQAMTNVALNRVGQREWSQYTTVAEICQYTGFDGYGSDSYWECMDYLNNRDRANAVYEKIIWDVFLAYRNDITDGCQLYYTPAAMVPENSVPDWDFSVLEERTVFGVDPYYEGRFFAYRR